MYIQMSYKRRRVWRSRTALTFVSVVNRLHIHSTPRSRLQLTSCVSESDCECEGEEGGLEVVEVVEGVDGAGTSECEGVGFVDDCMTGDEDRT
jgi:hypothetical protein